jgi:hypothetical protein
MSRIARPIVAFARAPFGPKIHSRVWNPRRRTMGPVTTVTSDAEPVDCVVVIGIRGSMMQSSAASTTGR